MRGTLPSGAEIARRRLVDKMTFGAIATEFRVSRQAVHKNFKRWAEANGVDWKTTRAVQN